MSRSKSRVAVPTAAGFARDLLVDPAPSAAPAKPRTGFVPPSYEEARAHHASKAQYAFYQQVMYSLGYDPKTTEDRGVYIRRGDGRFDEYRLRTQKYRHDRYRVVQLFADLSSSPVAQVLPAEPFRRGVVIEGVPAEFTVVTGDCLNCDRTSATNLATWKRYPDNIWIDTPATVGGKDQKRVLDQFYSIAQEMGGARQADTVSQQEKNLAVLAGITLGLDAFTGCDVTPVNSAQFTTESVCAQIAKIAQERLGLEFDVREALQFGVDNPSCLFLVVLRQQLRLWRLERVFRPRDDDDDDDDDDDVAAAADDDGEEDPTAWLGVLLRTLLQYASTLHEQVSGDRLAPDVLAAASQTPAAAPARAARKRPMRANDKSATASTSTQVIGDDAAQAIKAASRKPIRPVYRAAVTYALVTLTKQFDEDFAAKMDLYPGTAVFQTIVTQAASIMQESGTFNMFTSVGQGDSAHYDRFESHLLRTEGGERMQVLLRQLRAIEMEAFDGASGPLMERLIKSAMAAVVSLVLDANKTDDYLETARTATLEQQRYVDEAMMETVAEMQRASLFQVFSARVGTKLLNKTWAALRWMASHLLKACILAGKQSPLGIPFFLNAAYTVYDGARPSRAYGGVVHWVGNVAYSFGKVALLAMTGVCIMSVVHVLWGLILASPDAEVMANSTQAAAAMEAALNSTSTALRVHWDDAIWGSQIYNYLRGYSLVGVVDRVVQAGLLVAAKSYASNTFVQGNMTIGDLDYLVDDALNDDDAMMELAYQKHSYLQKAILKGAQVVRDISMRLGWVAAGDGEATCSQEEGQFRLINETVTRWEDRVKEDVQAGFAELQRIPTEVQDEPTIMLRVEGVFNATGARIIENQQRMARELTASETAMAAFAAQGIQDPRMAVDAATVMFRQLWAKARRDLVIRGESLGKQVSWFTRTIRNYYASTAQLFMIAENAQNPAIPMPVAGTAAADVVPIVPTFMVPAMRRVQTIKRIFGRAVVEFAVKIVAPEHETLATIVGTATMSTLVPRGDDRVLMNQVATMSAVYQDVTHTYLASKASWEQVASWTPYIVVAAPFVLAAVAPVAAAAAGALGVAMAGMTGAAVAGAGATAAATGAAAAATGAAATATAATGAAAAATGAAAAATGAAAAGATGAATVGGVITAGLGTMAKTKVLMSAVEMGLAGATTFARYYYEGFDSFTARIERAPRNAVNGHRVMSFVVGLCPAALLYVFMNKVHGHDLYAAPTKLDDTFLEIYRQQGPGYFRALLRRVYEQYLVLRSFAFVMAGMATVAGVFASGIVQRGIQYINLNYNIVNMIVTLWNKRDPFSAAAALFTLDTQTKCQWLFDLSSYFNYPLDLTIAEVQYGVWIVIAATTFVLSTAILVQTFILSKPPAVRIRGHLEEVLQDIVHSLAPMYKEIHDDADTKNPRKLHGVCRELTALTLILRNAYLDKGEEGCDFNACRDLIKKLVKSQFEDPFKRHVLQTAIVRSMFHVVANLVFFPTARPCGVQAYNKCASELPNVWKSGQVKLRRRLAGQSDVTTVTIDVKKPVFYDQAAKRFLNVFGSVHVLRLYILACGRLNPKMLQSVLYYTAPHVVVNNKTQIYSIDYLMRDVVTLLDRTRVLSKTPFCGLNTSLSVLETGFANYEFLQNLATAELKMSETNRPRMFLWALSPTKTFHAATHADLIAIVSAAVPETSNDIVSMLYSELNRLLAGLGSSN